MPFDQLPSEILYLITERLELLELRCLLLTAKRVGAVAEESLYSRMVASDERDLLFPLSLVVAAITDSPNAFKGLLEKANPNFLRSCKYVPPENPHFAKWLNSARGGKVSLLHILCGLGREEMVRLALERCGGSYLGDLDYERKTPLIRATVMDQVGTMKLLLETGADPTESNTHGQAPLLTPLSHAIRMERTAAAEFLIRAGAKVHFTEDEEWSVTPLALAVHTRNAHMADLLLEAGAGADGNLDHALRATCADGNDLPIVELLLNAGAQAHPRSLTDAAQNGYIELLNVLISHGGEFEEYPKTPLHDDKCSLPVVRMILSEAPHLANVRDYRGSTPLDTLLEYPNTDRLEDLDSIAKCLIQAGGEVTGIPLGGLTVLQMAISKGFKGLVELLLSLESQKALISTRGRGGLTALHYACSNSSSDCPIFTEWLIAAGIDTSIRTESGETALHLAVSNSHSAAVSCVRMLINERCDKNATNDKDQNVLHLAALTGNSNTVQYLLQAGIDSSQRDWWGCTPLRLAVVEGIWSYTALAGYAYRAGLNFLGGSTETSLQDVPQDKLLAYNSWRSHLEVMRQLVEAGADVSIENYNGDTVLDLIARECTSEILQERDLKGADDLLSLLNASQLNLR